MRMLQLTGSVHHSLFPMIRRGNHTGFLSFLPVKSLIHIFIVQIMANNGSTNFILTGW